MLLLAIEHSTARHSVALLDDERVLGTRGGDPRRREAGALYRDIRGLLDDAGTTPAAIALFAVGLGPGVYSNLRTSLATAHGLALPGGRPVRGASSAEALALRATADRDAARVAVVGDARRNRLWIAHIAVRGGGAHTTSGTPFTLTRPEELAAELHPDTTVVSPDWERLAGVFADLKTRNLTVVDEPMQPAAEEIGRLALAAERRGDVAAGPLTPYYVHPPVPAKPVRQQPAAHHASC